jgi:Flp pilus assembly protein TadD
MGNGVARRPQRDRGPFRLVVHAQRGGTAPAARDVDALSEDAAAADEQAVASFRRALENDPGEVDYHYLLGEALLRLGRAREALPQLLEAVRLQPHDAAYLDALGCALWRHGRLDEAATAFQEAVRLAPEHVAARGGLAGVLVEMDRPQQAVTILQSAIELDGRDGRLYTNLAIAHWRLGEEEEARAAFRKAAQLRPGSAAVQRNLAYAMSAAGDVAAALAAFRQAVSLRPDDAQAQADLADALFAAGRIREAEAAFAEAVRLDPYSLADRETSQKARAAMLGAQLRDEMRREDGPPSVPESGWNALLAAPSAARTVAGMGRRLRTAGAALLLLALARVGWVLIPPHVSHYLFQDDVTEIARAPVRDDGDVRDRLQHAVEERGLGGLVDTAAFEIVTKPKWRRITGDYQVPVRVFPGWSPTLRFHVAAEQPYIVFERNERGRLVIPDP